MLLENIGTEMGIGVLVKNACVFALLSVCSVFVESGPSLNIPKYNCIRRKTLLLDFVHLSVCVFVCVCVWFVFVCVYVCAHVCLRKGGVGG